MSTENKQQGSPTGKIIPKAKIDMNKAVKWLSTWSAWLVVVASIGILAVVAFFISENFSQFAREYGLYFIVNAFCTIAIFMSFFRDGSINGKQQDGFVTNMSLYLDTSKNRRKDKVEQFLSFCRKQERLNYENTVCDITGLTLQQVKDLNLAEAYIKFRWKREKIKRGKKTIRKPNQINKIQYKHIWNIQNDNYPDTVPSSANRVLSALGTRYRKDTMVDLDASKRYTAKKFIAKIASMIIFSFPAGFLALESVAKDPWAAVLKLFVSILLFSASIIGGYQGGFRSMAEIEKDTLGELVKLFNAMDEWEANPPLEEVKENDKRTTATGAVDTQRADTNITGESSNTEQSNRLIGDYDQSSSRGDHSLGQVTGIGTTERSSATVNKQPVNELPSALQSAT